MPLSKPDSTATLTDWLEYIESLHHTPIELGLDRVRAAATQLGLRLPFIRFVVGGTNGKGSTCAVLEAILLAAGYRVGLYTSPHLIEFNERIRVDGKSASDEQIIEHFQKVEAARASITLTYFEYATLAALSLFESEAVDVVVLEVGMGGRLDAVNIVDADCSIVTSVDLDHTEWLGDTREKIGWEKAHIYRPGRPAICGDPVAPSTLIDYAKEIGADLWLFGKDFNYGGDRLQWSYGGRGQRRRGLAYPSLRGANQLLNVTAALAGLESLREKLVVPQQAVRLGLQMSLPGRLQILPGHPTIVLDVAHNPHAAAALGQNLDGMSYFPQTHAVFGMLRDKDIAGVVAKMASRVDHWYCATLEGPRGVEGGHLAEIVRAALPTGPKKTMVSTSAIRIKAPNRIPAVAARRSPIPVKEKPPVTVASFDDPVQAFAEAQKQASGDDRIVVFGSFKTVGPVLKDLGRKVN